MYEQGRWERLVDGGARETDIFSQLLYHSCGSFTSMLPGLPKPPGQGGLWSLAGAVRWAWA